MLRIYLCNICQRTQNTTSHQVIVVRTVVKNACVLARSSIKYFTRSEMNRVRVSAPRARVATSPTQLLCDAHVLCDAAAAANLRRAGRREVLSATRARRCLRAFLRPEKFKCIDHLFNRRSARAFGGSQAQLCHTIIGQRQERAHRTRLTRPAATHRACSHALPLCVCPAASGVRPSHARTLSTVSSPL